MDALNNLEILYLAPLSHSKAACFHRLEHLCFVEGVHSEFDSLTVSCVHEDFLTVKTGMELRGKNQNQLELKQLQKQEGHRIFLKIVFPIK